MTMGKFISNLFLGVLAVGLSIFTASRTLDLLTWALPAGQTIYTWLGLAAFEGGMYFWAFFFISGAKGTPQRSISLLMAVFSVIAVCVATVVDLSLGASESGKLPALSASVQQSMIIFVGVVIALNVAAFLACHLMAPEKLREIKSGQAEDRIFAEGLRAIEALAPSIAADAAPHLAADWANRTWQQIVPGVPRRMEYLGPASASVPALPAGAPEQLPALPPIPDREPQPEQDDRVRCSKCGRWVRSDFGSWRQVSGGDPVFSCLDCTPVARGKKPGFMAKAKSFLGLGGEQKQESVTLAHTGEIAASEKTSNQIYREEQRAARKSLPGNQVAAARRARRAARMRGVVTVSNYQATETAKGKRKEAIPAPEQEAREVPQEHRTCSECGAALDLKNAKQLTCSDACRARRSRRLALEREAQKAGK